MSLINKFTIGFNLDKARRKSMFETNNTSFKMNQMSEDPNRQILSQELVEILISFGFELKQIMIAFKEYKFINIDEACHYMMKDNETGKFNHRFIRGENDENPRYSNLKTNVCIICGSDPTEHFDFNIESRRLNGLAAKQDDKNFNNNHFKAEMRRSNSDNNKYIMSEYNSNYNLKGENNKDMSSNLMNIQDKSMDKISNLNIGNSENIDNIENNGKNNQNLPTDIHNNMNESQNHLLKKVEKPNNVANIKIEIPPETLDLFEDPDICRICFDEKMTQNNKAEFACGHKFCRKCVTNYLKNSITNGKV